MVAFMDSGYSALNVTMVSWAPTYQTNNKTVELQIMRKFMTSGILGNKQYSLPEEFKDFFLFSCISQFETSENSGEIV